MAEKRTPKEVNADILAALDLVEEYRRLGVRYSSQPPQPRPSGWVECFARGREEGHPSAAINVRTGRYIDKGGDCESLSFWDFAVKYGNFGDYKSTRKHYADLVGMKLDGRGRPAKRPENHLEILEWTEGNIRLARIWAEKRKKGITVEAIRASGAVPAMYPKKSRQFKVIALPVYGRQWLEAEPVAYVLWDIHGRELPVWKEGGGVDRMVKMKSLGPVSGGMAGFWGLSRLTGPLIDSGVEHVWLTEGPTDMLALWSAMPAEYRERHLVLCNAGGSTEHVQPHILDLFSGMQVGVLRDADKAGEIGAVRWCESLKPSCPEIRHVRLPYPVTEKNGRDLRDFLLGNGFDGEPPRHDYQSLMDSFNLTPVFVPSTKVQLPPIVRSLGDHADGEEQEPILADEIIERRIVDALGIDVIGEYSDGSILVFAGHESRRKEAVIDKIERLSYARLLQIAGTPVKELVVEETSEAADDDTFTVDQVRNAIAYIGGRRPLGDQSISGVGCWQEVSYDDEPRPGVVLVGSGESAVWNGKSLKKMIGMRGGGRLLGVSGHEEWYDHDRLAAAIEAATPGYAMATIEEAEQLFSKWRWRNQEISPTVMVGLVMATWVQTLWPYRPQVAITGASNTGKSTLFEALCGMFGPLSMRSSKSSAAGIRQAIQTSARIMLCDEFEKSKHRPEILEMIRASSRGDSILMGTSQQRSKEFVVRHIIWVAAIETGLRREPDYNRFVSLELVPPLSEDRGKLNCPPQSVLRDIGQRLLAITLRNIEAAKGMAVRMKSQNLQGVAGRAIESYAVPVSILAAATGLGDEEADHMLLTFLDGCGTDVATSSDADDLMQSILGAQVPLGRGEIKTVAQLIQAGGLDAKEALERNGIVLTTERSGPRVNGWDHIFLDCRTVEKYLLSRSEWEGQSTEQIIRRIDGSKRIRCRVGGRRPYGILVPAESISEVIDSGESYLDEKPGPLVQSWAN